MSNAGEGGGGAGKLAHLPVSEPVSIPVGRVVLEGQLEIPKDVRGLVLFAHGSGSSRHSPRNQFVASVLRNAGNGTLLFDLLTLAEEKEDAATGHLRFDIRFLAERLEAATHWAGLHLATRRLPIGYFGSSTGGAAALLAAATLPSSVEAVVSRGGRSDLAREALPLVSAPTLLIVGELDKTVLHLNESAYEDLTCRKALAVVPHATHLFEEHGALEEVARLAADWFREYLKPAR